VRLECPLSAKSRQRGHHRPLVILLISDNAFAAAALTKSRVRLPEPPGPGPPPSKSRFASTLARDLSWAIARWLSCGTIVASTLTVIQIVTIKTRKHHRRATLSAWRKFVARVWKVRVERLKLIGFIGVPNFQLEPRCSPMRGPRNFARVIERFRSSSLRVIVHRNETLQFFLCDQFHDLPAFCFASRACQPVPKKLQISTVDEALCRRRSPLR
jgi:hypothetical protein